MILAAAPYRLTFNISSNKMDPIHLLCWNIKSFFREQWLQNKVSICIDDFTKLFSKSKEFWLA